MFLLTLLREKKISFAALASALLCGILILVVLNVPQEVGLANNGDFIRIIQPNGIAYVDNNSNLYEKYVPNYEMNITGNNFVEKLIRFLRTDYSRYDYVSSQSLVIKVSKVLNAVHNKLTGKPTGNYDLFWLGVAYVVIFVLSIYLILKFIYRRFGCMMFLLASLVFLFVFCDQGYVLYFNSFFGEAMQYVSTFLVIGLFLQLLEQSRKGIFLYLLYYAAVVIMATSKHAYVPIGLLFSLLPLVFIKKSSVPWQYIISMTTLSFGVLVIYFSFHTPEWIDRDTNFNSVFSGVLKFSDTPEQDLEEMGLDKSLAVLKGWESYQSDYPIDIESDAFATQFYDKISKTKILFFYLKHPVRWMEALEYSAGFSQYIRPRYLTNTQNPAVSREQSYRFSLWEKFRVWSGMNYLWVTLGIFFIVFCVCMNKMRVSLKTNVELPLLLMAILFSASFNFVIPYISNGVCDIAKHMFGFIHLYDLLLFILLGYLIRRLQVGIRVK